MPEPIALWWARRQFSRDALVPYEVGAYREAWAAHPALVRQYHPDLNHGIVLSQIPPAADVLLCWQCEAGHKFAATPTEQRERPGRTRRRSAWCPECSALAIPLRARAFDTPAAPSRPRSSLSPICDRTPNLPMGDPFCSECAPKPASAVEGRLRADLEQRLTVTHGLNAVRTRRAFFQHREVWPDILLPELRIAIEYDSIGRHGLEHVGKRQDADRRKDRTLRESGWEIVRVRTGNLEPIGPYDLATRSLTSETIGQLIERFRDIRGSLLVDAYLA